MIKHETAELYLDVKLQSVSSLFKTQVVNQDILSGVISELCERLQLICIMSPYRPRR